MHGAHMQSHGLDVDLGPVSIMLCITWSMNDPIFALEIEGVVVVLLPRPEMSGASHWTALRRQMVTLHSSMPQQGTCNSSSTFVER